MSDSTSTQEVSSCQKVNPNQLNKQTQNPSFKTKKVILGTLTLNLME
jgi:hypothetical protein